MRYCKDIAMYVTDRPQSSCLHRTRFCARNCYNKKLYKLYPNMRGAETKIKEEWDNLNSDTFRKQIKSKRKSTKRFRFQTRGETFSSFADVVKVRDIIAGSPNITFWIPTRAWRDPFLKTSIETMVMTLPNARVQASIDPSNSEAELLIASEWSTMFFGDNENHPLTDNVKCPKTWAKKKRACQTCNIGCFKTEKTNVWLKKH